jgi:glycosyltransferase involved in cell wall biosynthesis
MTQNKLSKKNRTIIDITQLVHWGGGLTGIPRVMNELSLRYAKQPDTLFVVWNKEADCFYELDIHKSLSQRGQGIFFKSKKETPSVAAAVDQKTPQERFLSVLKRAAKKAEKYNPEMYKKAASRFNKTIQVNAGPIVQMAPRDELIVLWGEWGDEKYRAALLRAKEQRVTLIQVVYDMLPIVTPQYSGHSTAAMHDYYTQIIPICDLVLSISEYTKKDLAEWLRDQKLIVPKIEVFRLGDDFALSEPKKPTDDLFTKMVAKEPYILCVGTVEARKNHTLLYYVYKLAKNRSVKLPKLVIVGRRGWKTDDIFDIISSDPDVKDNFVFMQGISDEELSWLYRNCMFTVYPSFYEGWGLPIAESIAYGKPCLSSNTSSMPEVAGDLIDYFSPLSTDECFNALVKLLSGKELDNATKRISKYKITPWDSSYAQVDKAIKELYA